MFGNHIVFFYTMEGAAPMYYRVLASAPDHDAAVALNEQYTAACRALQRMAADGTLAACGFASIDALFGV